MYDNDIQAHTSQKLYYCKRNFDTAEVNDSIDSHSSLLTSAVSQVILCLHTFLWILLQHLHFYIIVYLIEKDVV